MKTVSGLILLFFLFACGQPQKTESQTNENASTPPPPQETTPPLIETRSDTIPQKPAGNPNEKANVEVKTFQNNDGEAKGTWGYDVYIEKRPYIHQPSMPSVPGNSGFGTEAKAHKAGEFVVYKVKHNIMPPAISPHELDSLGVLN